MPTFVTIRFNIGAGYKWTTMNLGGARNKNNFKKTLCDEISALEYGVLPKFHVLRQFVSQLIFLLKEKC